MMMMILTSFAANATTLISDGEIHGRIKSKEKGESLEFVSVVVMINEHVIASTTTDEQGYFSLKPLQAGSYTLKAVMMGYNPYQMNDVTVNSDKTTVVDVSLLSSDSTLPITEVYEYVHPLIDRGDVSDHFIIETKEIKNAPYTDVKDLAATAAGVVQKEEGGELFVRGSRSNATQYVIDGVKTNGGFRIPKNAIKEITVLTGGIPAMFGDATGGIIMITTKGYLGW